MQKKTVRVRGIYATALTKLFLDHGMAVADPSEIITARFQADERLFPGGESSAEIQDRFSRQGVLISGDPQIVHSLTGLLREASSDVLCWEQKALEYEAFVLKLEFPAPAKAALDTIRAQVAPTIKNHHWLRVIDSDAVDRIEEQLAKAPDQAVILARRIEEDLLWSKYGQGTSLRIQHVKPSGRTYHLKTSTILRCDRYDGRLLLLRSGFREGGRYDGIGRIIEEGDFCLTEVVRGAWYYRHTYYRRDGKPVGAYYNINSPVEFYPDLIRYVDLEIDVAQWPEGRVSIIDEDDLDLSLDLGRISPQLHEQALKIAREVKKEAESQELKTATDYTD